MGVCIGKPRGARPELRVQFRGKYQGGYRGRHPEAYQRVYGDQQPQYSGKDYSIQKKGKREEYEGILLNQLDAR